MDDQFRGEPMSERFIKFIPSEEAFWLMKHKPNAFNLLAHIANTARRTNGNPDGLLIGQCHLQSWSFYGLTEREYRTAKQILVQRKHIIIIETNRNRQKSTTGTTTRSTLVQLCNSTIWDINSENKDDLNDVRETTERRQTRKKQECIKKTTTTKPPSSEKIIEMDSAAAVFFEELHFNPSPPLFDCLKPLSISEPEKLWISEKYSEEEVEHAVKVTLRLEEQNEIKTSFIQTLKWACKTQPELPKSSEDDFEENRKYANQFNLNKTGSYETLKNGVEFIFGPASPAKFVQFNQPQAKFKQILDEELLRFGVKKQQTGQKNNAKHNDNEQLRTNA